ncbi:hypothetical protein FNF29_05414 [Cafeteria roenbergensis]|uniref:VTT domain-containing protein n=1 Tax=Cafeteria roenbergensis TaxID=33653 RepID=A0A5A8DZC1_CAFRO|nr:hypothetical protein FNF29_05414 [Cafeteria roenbergensis]KAA0170064.1 hypothetical protein FNF28_01673 [Cafeteria roenbergensis]|eukprot:KAA0150174.1 hypothetical protein FNF29_05414 [Cafeteria roenbergensis]
MTIEVTKEGTPVASPGRPDSQAASSARVAASGTTASVSPERPAGAAGSRAGAPPDAEGWRTWKCGFRVLLLLVVLAAAAYIVVDSLTTMQLTKWFEDFLRWLRANLVLGSAAFAGVYVVATTCFFPGSILTLGAGFTFSAALGQGAGIAVATAVVFLGASLGATLAFFIGRYVLRDVAQSWSKKYRILGAIDRAIAKSGLRLMLLLRLSPVIPFSAFNYVAAATGVSIRDFVIANVAIIPGTVAYCYFGSLLSNVKATADGEVGDPALQWGLIAVGTVATVAALVTVTCFARRELNAALTDESSEEEDAGQSPAAGAAAAADPTGRGVIDDSDGPSGMGQAPRPTLLAGSLNGASTSSAGAAQGASAKGTTSAGAMASMA